MAPPMPLSSPTFPLLPLPVIHTREVPCPSLPANITVSEILYLRNLNSHYNWIGIYILIALVLSWFIIITLFFSIRLYWRKRYPGKYMQYELDCLETHMEAVYRLGDRLGDERGVRMWDREADAEEQMKGMARRARRSVREGGGRENVRLRDVVGGVWGGWRGGEGRTWWNFNWDRRNWGGRDWYGRRVGVVEN